MLSLHDIRGMAKRGADFSMLNGSGRAAIGPTLGDLVDAIQADRGLTAVESQQLLAEVQRLAGAHSDSTPLSSLMFSGFGGILGYLISKYFGMGNIGQAVSAMAGFGLGRSLFNAMNAPPDPYAGHRLLH